MRCTRHMSNTWYQVYRINNTTDSTLQSSSRTVPGLISRTDGTYRYKTLSIEHCTQTTHALHARCTTFTGFVRRAVVGAVVTSTSVQVASNILRAVWGNGASGGLDTGVLVSQSRVLCVMHHIIYYNVIVHHRPLSSTTVLVLVYFCFFY